MNFTAPKWLYSKNSLIAIYVIMVIYIIIEKLYIYSAFNVKYTDEDQCILWLAADELLHGHFREPCFFGQDYNSCLEGWLSVPFLWMGLNLNEAIPLTTLIISVIPFLWLSFIYLKQKEYLISIVILFCLLIFSLNYQFVSVMPRGFITGVFCFGIGHALLVKNVRFHFFWFTLFAGFGFFINETTVFLILPVIFSHWLKNIKSKQFYLQCILGLLLPLAYKVYVYIFYHVLNLEYNSYRKDKFGWELGNLTKAFQHLDDWWFGDFTLILVSFCLLMAIFIWKKKYTYASMLFACFALLFLLFCLKRFHEGEVSIMYSKSRLFVFMPLMMAVFFVMAISELKLSIKQQFFAAMILFTIITIQWTKQINGIEEYARKEVVREPKVVTFLPVKTVYELSYRYIALCKNTGNNFILYDGVSKIDMILYLTIPLLSNNQIKTFEPVIDRRTWFYWEVLNYCPKKITVLRNWGEKYDRPTLKDYERRQISGGEDCMVEYKLKRSIEYTVWFDFQTSLRIYTNREQNEKWNKIK